LVYGLVQGLDGLVGRIEAAIRIIVQDIIKLEDNLAVTFEANHIMEPSLADQIDFHTFIEEVIHNQAE